MAKTFELRQVGGPEAGRLLGLVQLQDDRRPVWFRRAFAAGEVHVEAVTDELPPQVPEAAETIAVGGGRKRGRR